MYYPRLEAARDKRKFAGLTTRATKHAIANRKSVLFALTGALVSTTASLPSTAFAEALPTCGAIANLLSSNKDIATATSSVQPATSTDKSYCLVNITVSDLSGPKDGYLPGQKQMIKIAIGLPLSVADGGNGGVQGNWNGRIQDIGNAGYAGTILPVLTAATDAGYAGSNTDTGHSGGPGSGIFAINPDDSLNWGLIRDFAFNGIHEQSVWTKKLVRMYYGMKQKYAYWTGCSTGGRQGHQQAQKYPKEYDGILAGDGAINWDRFIPAELWPQVVMNQETGGPISPAKLNAVTQAAIAACDGLDGIKDGILQDPRACHYSAKSFVCTGKADPANCLTSGEAAAVDKIWNGVEVDGKRIWFGLERGSPLVAGFFGGGLAAAAPFPITVDHLRYWVEKNPAFDWHTYTEETFIQAMLDGEKKFHDVIGTDDPDLSDFRQSGGKLIAYYGLADELIFPRGMYNYYNRVTERMGGIHQVQEFYRFFPYPGGNHCAGNTGQPNAPLMDETAASGNLNVSLFNALINWVEHGTAPDSIIAYNNATPALATVSRPICKYPDRLVYKGSGSTNVAANFFCQKEKNDPLMLEDFVLPDPGASRFDHDDK
jgi:hypothetical protein